MVDVTTGAKLAHSSTFFSPDEGIRKHRRTKRNLICLAARVVRLFGRDHEDTDCRKNGWFRSKDLYTCLENRYNSLRQTTGRNSRPDKRYHPSFVFSLLFPFDLFPVLGHFLSTSYLVRWHGTAKTCLETNTLRTRIVVYTIPFSSWTSSYRIRPADEYLCNLTCVLSYQA